MHLPIPYTTLFFFFLIFFFSTFPAESIEEHIEYNTTLAEKLAEKYCNSTYYQETKAILENISLGNTKKTKAFFRQITYTNSFCHQLKWVSRRTFKNMVGNPQASIAQVRLFVSIWSVINIHFQLLLY